MAALIDGGAGSLGSVTGSVLIIGNESLPTCTARKVHDALGKKPSHFCYLNKADACSDDPDICKEGPMP